MRSTAPSLTAAILPRDARAGPPSGAADLLLRRRRLASLAEPREIGARVVLALALGARRDGGAHVLGREAERVDEILRVRPQAIAEPVDVPRDGGRALRRQPPVEQVPRQVPLDEREAEQVAHPREDRARAGVVDARERIGERLPLQQLAVRAGRLEQLDLVVVEDLLRLG